MKSKHLELFDNLRRLNKVAVGFEPYFKNFEHSIYHTNGNYPPYNVIVDGEDDFIIEIAVSGFSKDEIVLEQNDSMLKVNGLKPEQTEQIGYYHKGISTRSFELSWTLAQHVEVTSADMKDGILTVRLHRNVPDGKKPKIIKIA